MVTHLLTGAGSGIGALLAERLLERGDDLVLLARSAERAHDLREELPGCHRDIRVAFAGPARCGCEASERLEGLMRSL